MAKVTSVTLQARKRAGKKIAAITAYDFPTAQAVDAAGVDAVLVGDSVGMAVMGHDTTLGVTMDHMVYHTSMVTRGIERALVIGDLPFLSYQVNPEDAVRNAGRLIAEAGAQAVKLEGSTEKFGAAIAGMIRASIPVMGHIGLTPQSVHKFGGYKVQGRDDAGRKRLKEEALGLQDAGCFALVLECVPPDLAGEITETLEIPTIGIGAGPLCDGQILVLHDILGWGKTRFCKTFGDIKGAMERAVTDYSDAVKTGTFPAKEHCYTQKPIDKAITDNASPAQTPSFQAAEHSYVEEHSYT